ncbi:MAG TPA: NAD(P)H-dependent oxidoreductase [Bacteroidales bacterium]|jgi:NAD(P)H-dependent FMN reductase|nr:NAD(P)H-dependent oxidoreductase [Bacteroidales bacterium]
MDHICIISSSIRKERFSHRAALYLSAILKDRYHAEVEILDLLEYNFPLFEERLKYLDAPTAETLDFAEKVRKADGLILVVPEYNGGYPASIKNVIDLLTDEWRRKPVAFAVVSNGQFAGSQVIFSLQFTLWKIMALTVSPAMRIADIETSIDENGIPADKALMDKKASATIKELLWHIEAVRRMKIQDRP